jgi:hypothetical protein
MMNAECRMNTQKPRNLFHQHIDNTQRSQQQADYAVDGEEGDADL